MAKPKIEKKPAAKPKVQKEVAPEAPSMTNLLALLQQLPALMNQLIQVQNQNSRDLHELKTFVKVLTQK
jgi:hypothetical protein